MVNGRLGKIVCIAFGIIFIIVAMYGIAKNIVAEKTVATVVNIIDYYTTSKDVRAGNDGGRDSNKEYGMVAEIRIGENPENVMISISRRMEENLPRIGDEICVKKGNDGKWYEYEPVIFSVGTIVLLVMGGITLLIGLFGKVK